MTPEFSNQLLTEVEVISAAEKVKVGAPTNYGYGRGEFRYLVFENLVSSRDLPMVDHEVGGRIPDYDNPEVRALNTDLERFTQLLRSQI